MLSVVTLRVLITAHAALDTMEMEHHAPVNHVIIIIFIIIIIIIIITTTIIILLLFFIFIIISILIAELSREARSGAPWVKECGKLPIRENLVIT